MAESHGPMTSSAPDCCRKPAPARDPRWEGIVGPALEGVMRCGACDALWHYTYETRTRYDGEPDTELENWKRLSEWEADRLFPRTGSPPVR